MGGGGEERGRGGEGEGRGGIDDPPPRFSAGYGLIYRFTVLFHCFFAAIVIDCQKRP